MDGPIKLTTLKNFIKKHSGFRLEGAAAEILAASINERIVNLVDRAAVLVEMQGKSTLQLEHMQQALFEEKEQQGGGRAPEDVAALVDGYPVSELGRLVELLRQSLEAGR